MREQLTEMFAGSGFDPKGISPASSSTDGDMPIAAHSLAYSSARMDSRRRGRSCAVLPLGASLLPIRISPAILAIPPQSRKDNVQRASYSIEYSCADT